MELAVGKAKVGAVAKAKVGGKAVGKAVGKPDLGPGPWKVKAGAGKETIAKAMAAATAGGEKAAGVASGMVLPTPIGHKEVHRIPLNQLVEWPRNPRRTADKDVVASIAASLVTPEGEERGLLTPVSVMVLDPGLLAYTVYMGSQRLAAYKHNVQGGLMANDVLVDCFVDDVDEETAYLRAILENVARGNMHEMDRAEAILTLAEKRHTVIDIANNVGMSRRDVFAAIDVARLDERSKGLVRSNKRSFAWAHTLTGGDAPFRNRVLDDIEASPTSWMTLEQLRGGMKMNRVNVRHALFDTAKAGIQTTPDMLDGSEWFKDRGEFWKHQDEAIDARREELERDGHVEVQVLRGTCHEAHLYRADPEAKGGKVAFIEVGGDGFVNVVSDLVPVGVDDGLFDQVDAIANSQEGSGEGVTTIPPRGKAAKILIDVVGDAAMASVERVTGLRLLAAALIEDDEIRIAGSAGRTPNQARDREETIVAALGRLPERGERIALDELPADEVALAGLLHKLTLTALTPCRTRTNPFEKADQGTLLRRALAEDPAALRRGWTPGKEFLEALELRELRALGVELLGAETDFVPDAMSKGQLVAYVADAFDGVATGRSTFAAETQMMLANWRPDYLV